MPDDTTEMTKYKRVMLKISGEALMSDLGFGLHPPTVQRIAREIESVHALGVEICMVIGGGNIFRGLQGSAEGMERTTADYMGMLATVMNALAMQSALEDLGVFTRVISAIPMDQVCEPYIRRRAVRHLDTGAENPTDGSSLFCKLVRHLPWSRLPFRHGPARRRAIWRQPHARPAESHDAHRHA